MKVTEENLRALQAMLDEQRTLQEKSFGHSMAAWTDEERVEYIRWNVLALTDEAHEALAETSWKPWTSKTFVNEDELKSELVDCWFFLQNLMLAAGMDADDLFHRYRAKAERNRQRMASGEYDGVKDKCPSCQRELDKPNSLVGSLIDGVTSIACLGCEADVPEDALTDLAKTHVEWTAQDESPKKRRLSGFCSECGVSFDYGDKPFLRPSVERINKTYVNCCNVRQPFKQLQRFTVHATNNARRDISYIARGANADDLKKWLTSEGLDPQMYDFTDPMIEEVEGT